MSRNMDRNMEPMINSDGKFVCEADNKTFNTRAEYDRHCSSAHMSNNRSSNRNR